MAESRSQADAWEVVRRVWSQMRAEDAHREGLGRVTEKQMHNLFDLFWDAQFEDNRISVRESVDGWAKLITEVVSPDED